jgi:hypothetical protein
VTVLSLRKPLAAVTAVTAAFAIAVPATNAGAATVPVAPIAGLLPAFGLTCPMWNSLPTRSTGTCLPSWMYPYPGPIRY